MRFYENERKRQWHQFFVIWPRIVYDKRGKLCTVWLETILRRQDERDEYEYQLKT